MMGIEPTTFGTTTRRSNQLSYIRHIPYVVCSFSEQLVRASSAYSSLRALQPSYIRHISYDLHDYSIRGRRFAII